MLQSIKELYGRHLGTSDGNIGHVKDFYFDDRTWAVRYVVADTGKWLPGRQVLLSPHAFSHPLADKIMRVNLTRKQIEDSPSIETHQPVSRQYEEEYHRYYGWPNYWEGDGLWGGMRGFPILAVPNGFSPNKPAPGSQPNGPDADLRSSQAVNGYHLQATDGIIGHVCDFLMDDKSWAINQLVVKTGHRFTGKEVQIPISQVDRISYKESTVHVKVSQEAVEKSPEHRLVPNGADVSTQPALAL
jgi:sporulation protein YlmC with PRC-barrel domain